MSTSSNSRRETPQGQFIGRLGLVCLVAAIISGYVCVLGRMFANLDLVMFGAVFFGVSFGVLMGYALKDTR
jgi:hypothetical protein